mgnify:CR=1 FL=1
MKNFSDVRNLLLVVLLLFTNVVGSVSANGSKIIIRNGDYYVEDKTDI